jgi:photosystem II stability/assembly factor-like uncharacterized protein
MTNDLEQTAHFNRPGLPELSYRISDYATVRSRLLARLSQQVPDRPISLRQLTTRATDDPAIALMDACAVLVEVLTFYQERIANEGYLRTATERRSVLELARMVGYELDPGVAATTMVAFTVDEAPGSPLVATVPKGTQLLSVPNKDEVPQTYETDVEFVARAEWNNLQPRRDRPQEITPTTHQLFLTGISTNLQPGDLLLLRDISLPNAPFQVLTLETIAPQASLGYTIVTWNPAQSLINNSFSESPIQKTIRNPEVIAFRQRANLFGYNAPRWETSSDAVKISNGSRIKGGVYHYNATSKQTKWVAVNEGLLSYEIRSIVANPQNEYLFIATAIGIFRSKDNAKHWTPTNAGLSNTNVQTIGISDGHLWAGTAGGGVFRSIDQGESWSIFSIGSVAVREVPVVPATTPPTKKFETNNLGIPIGTVVRSIVTLVRSTTTPPITQTFFIFAGTDDGIYRSSNQGKSWEPMTVGLPTGDPILSLVVAGTVVLSRTAKKVYFSIDQGDHWSETNAVNPLSIVAAGDFIFVGTATGVFRSNVTTISFDSSATSPVPDAVWSIAVDPSNSQHLYAIAQNGVFQSTDQGSTWRLLTNQLFLDPATTVAAIQPRTDGMSQLFVGAPTIGFETLEWENFSLPESQSGLGTMLHLDTVYPKILAGSHILLRNGNHTEIITVAEILETQKQQFTLDAKVSQITAIKSLQNLSRFDRRTTIVLVQSDRLTPAHDPLTIAIQQQAIFLDPLTLTQIRLHQYVTGLQRDQRILISGKHPRAQINSLDSTLGGVVEWNTKLNTKLNSELNTKPNTELNREFKSQPKPHRWRSLNQGLTDTAVTALATDGETLFAGTMNSGVFQSIDQGTHWEPLNLSLSTLSTMEIQALAIGAGFLFAGTPTGMFRLALSNIDQARWESINQNLTHRHIKVLLVKDGILWAGTLKGGVFRSTDQGKTWSQTNLYQVDIQALLATEIPAEMLQNTPELAPFQQVFLGVTRLLFAGTSEDGTFYSIDDGITWRSIGAVRALKNITCFTVPLHPSPNNLLLAGTAGSGIFRLTVILDREEVKLQWETIVTNPTDLTIRCLLTDSTKQIIFASTVKGGIFQSIDEGNVWAPINEGLTPLDPRHNPTGQVNCDIRSLLFFQGKLYGAGVGTLISPDGLYSVPLKTGDRLQLLTPPTPVWNAEVNPELMNFPSWEYPQKWHIKDRDGFVGTVMTLNPRSIVIEAADPKQNIVSELGSIAIPPSEQQLPILTLAEAIQNAYDPETVTISANVIPTSHGETVTEVIGSGDGASLNQQFRLSKPPLTYLPVSAATTPNAIAPQSTLQIRVNEVLWEESPSLYHRNAQDAIYITRIEDDGFTSVTFGDGKSGLRLPSGVENIIATYRSGLGRSGQLQAGQLAQLKTKPLGIKSAINPLPAIGAADPETLLEARESAPRTVRTLGRIVSLQDYEDFARAFAGIGKAIAVVLWTGGLQQVHITVGAIAGDPVPTEDALYQSLVSAIDAARDPVQQVQIDSYDLLRFNLEARLIIDCRYIVDRVLDSVQSALFDRFDFERRTFGQAITAAEVIATIQSITGIIAVDLDALYRLDRPRSLEEWLPALEARWDPITQDIFPAQLLQLNPAGITLTVEVKL